MRAAGAARACAQLIERDRANTKDRFGATFVLALRPWSYAGFKQFERDSLGRRSRLAGALHARLLRRRSHSSGSYDIIE